MKGYEYLAHTIKAYGAEYIFYQELMFPYTLKEFQRIGGRPVMCHSEFGAGCMADGYARASKKPGVCAAQSAGAANLAASLQDAWLGCTPVVALTGRQVAARQYRNAYQELDHRLFFDGVTKFNATLEAPEQMPVLLRHCFRSAVTGKPRPTHIDLFGFCGLEYENAEFEAKAEADGRYMSYPSYRPAAAEEDIRAAAAAIAEAEKPLIVAGRGAVVSGAHKEVYEFASKCDIPIVTTCDGKTIIDEEDGLWAGICGTYGMDCANKTAKRSDLVIFIGTQANDQATFNWTAPAPSAKVIHIDIEPFEIGRNYSDCIGLAGDAKTVLAQLNQAVQAAKRPEWRKETGEAVSKFTDAQKEMMKADSDPITTGRLCGEISKNLPDDAVLVADTGWSAIWSATMIRMKASQLYLRAAGTLGWSFPASIGAKLAVPGRPVVCYTGDGGMLYFSNEIETAVRYNVPVVTVVNNNYAYAQIVGFMTQCGAYKENRPDCEERLSFTNKFSIARIAEEFGALGIRVTKAGEIGPAIRKALESGRPAVVEVITDGGEPLPALV